jgi:hypothetical protein
MLLKNPVSSVYDNYKIQLINQHTNIGDELTTKDFHFQTVLFYSINLNTELIF